MILNGGATVVKVFDKYLQNAQNSSILSKLDDMVWNVVKKNAQLPYYPRQVAMYINEKNGQQKDSGRYELLHKVVSKLNDENQIRTFEVAALASDFYVGYYMDSIVGNASEPMKTENARGAVLNLIRAGMEHNNKISASDANDAVDKLYNIYLYTQNIKPNLEIIP